MPKHIHKKSHTRKDRKSKQKSNVPQQVPADSLEYLQRVLGDRQTSKLVEHTDGPVSPSTQTRIQTMISKDPSGIVHLQRTLGNQRVIQMMGMDNKPKIKQGPRGHGVIQRGLFSRLFGKKTKKTAPTHEPGMYRAQPGEVKKAGSMTFFEMPTTFSKAWPGENGRYILSERGIGTVPLVLYGTRSEIIAWMGEHGNDKVANIISDTDDNDYDNPTDVFMKVKKSRGMVPVSRENVRALTPVHDVTQNLAEFAIGLGGGAVGGLGGGNTIGTALTDTAGGLKDLNDQRKWLKEHGSSKKKKDTATEPLFMIQFWIGGDQQIATRASHGVETGKGMNKRKETQITFTEIASLVSGQLG